MAESTDTLVDLLKQINKAADKGILGGAKADLRALNQYKGVFTELIGAVGKAYEDGLEGQAAGLQEVQEKLNESVKSYSGQIAKCMAHLRKNLSEAERRAAEDRLKGLKSELASRLKSNAQLAQREIANNAKILEDYKTKRLNLKKQVESQFLEMKLGDSVEGAFNSLTSALTDGGQSIGKGITKAFSVGAGLLASRQATLAFKAKQTTDKDEKANLEGMAQTMGSLGKTMLIIGASVGALFAVVKAFQAIEGAGKKVNKELISGVGATDLMANKTGDLYEEVNKTRKLLTRADFALSLGLTTDEAINLVKEFNSANFTLSSMGDNAEEATRRLHDMMMVVQSGATALGVSTSELIGFAEKYRMEMGMAANEAGFASRIAEDFKEIRDLALQSGYSTSKFFDKIKTLTEGIGKFNVRTQQAGKILLSLTKVIGPQAAEEFAKGLIGAFREESYTDRLKRLYTTNPKEVSKALEASAKAQANEYSRNFLKEGPAKDIFAKFGLSGSNLIEGTKKMSESDIKLLLGELQANGGEGAARAYYELMDAVRSKGTMGKVRQLGQADAGATLRVQAAQVAGILGGKSLREANLGQLKLLENFGYSAEKIEQFGKILELKGAELQELRSRGSLSAEDTAKYGVMKNAKGQLVNAETGEIIENVEAYLQAQGARLEEEFGNLEAPTLESIMQDNIRATQTSSERMSAHLGEIMQGVYDVAMGIYNHLFAEKQSDKAKQVQENLLAENINFLKNVNQSILDNNDKIRELKGEVDREKDPAVRKQKLEEIKALQDTNARLDMDKKLARESVSMLNKNKYQSENLDEMRRKVRSASAVSFAGSEAGNLQKLQETGIVNDRSAVSKVKAEAIAKQLGYGSSKEMLDALGTEGNWFGAISGENAGRIRKALGEAGLTAVNAEDNTVIGRSTYQGGMVLKGPEGGVVSTGSNVRELAPMSVFKEGLFSSGTKEADTDLNVLPQQPMDPLVQKGRKLDAQKQAEEMAKNPAMKKAREEGTYKGMKKAQQEQAESRIKGLASELDLDTSGTLKQIGKRFQDSKESLMKSNPEQARAFSETFSIAKESGFIDDGFIAKNGRVTRISDQDNILAFKNGGPADPSRRGATASINININGAKPGAVQDFERAVERVLRRTGVVIDPGNRST